MELTTPRPGFEGSMRTGPTPVARPGGGPLGIPAWVVGVVVLCLLGAVGVGFGYLFGGGWARATVKQGSMQQRQAAQSRVQMLNSQAMLYKLQHGGTSLDFVTYPNWEQLTQFSDAAGAVGPTKGAGRHFGPYLIQAPVNPLNQMGTVMVADGEPAFGDVVPDGRVAGFVFWPAGDQFYLTDVTGRRVADPLAGADSRVRAGRRRKR